MVIARVPAFESTLNKTNAWLKDLLAELGWSESDYQRAYHALRAVLHALRDRLTIEEATDLSAQLPMLIRGFYFEGWNPAKTPRSDRTVDEFLMRIADEFADDISVDTEAITRAVFRVLKTHISAGEIEHVAHSLPVQISQLWDDEPAA